jgi:hypothetical protein
MAEILIDTSNDGRPNGRRGLGRKLACACAAGLLCALAVIEYLNFTGFCYADKRYHSDQELIDLAITRGLKFVSELQGSEIYGSGEPIEYKSLAQFHQINPECCVLHRWGHSDLEEGLWVRAFNWYMVVAEIWYRIKSTGPNQFYRVTVFMNSCGVIKRIRGAAYASALPPVR